MEATRTAEKLPASQLPQEVPAKPIQGRTPPRSQLKLFKTV
jgi:hypothetical protein